MNLARFAGLWPSCHSLCVGGSVLSTDPVTVAEDKEATVSVTGMNGWNGEKSRQGTGGNKNETEQINGEVTQKQVC